MSMELVATVSSWSSGRKSVSARLVLPASRNRNSPTWMDSAARRASASLRPRDSSMRANIGCVAGVTGRAPP